MLDEVAQQLEFARGKVERLPVSEDLGTAEVDANGTKFEGDIAHRHCSAARRTPEERLDAREQFHHLKGLGEVVVCAQLETHDLVDDEALGSKHQDWRFDSMLTQVTAEVEAAAVRQH